MASLLFHDDLLYYSIISIVNQYIYRSILAKKHEQLKQYKKHKNFFKKALDKRRIMLYNLVATEFSFNT
nr:MAG TPA: hypothetical protein [Caudoviricetes sp.]